jgi:hypothetical protein
VSLGKGLEEISDNAFYECMSLREIIIPSRVRVNDSAFSHEVRIIDDNEKIENEDFVYLGQENYDIPADVARVIVHPSIRMIRSRAFFHCFNLTSVILNERLEEIGEEAFGYCASLREIVMIRDRAFYHCTCLVVNGGEGLEVIGVEAFWECKSLREILIPPHVRVIKDNAFSNCSQLRAVNGDKGLEEIGSRTFQFCTSLRKITVPPRVRVIQKLAFYHCSHLTVVILGKGLEMIPIKKK